jgi:hypothetical protein
VRVPWRWHWGSILAFLAQCAGWAGALYWSSFFAIPLSLWVAIQIKYQDQVPLPSPTEGDQYETVTRYDVQKRYNDAQTTFTPDVTPSK